MAEIIGLIASVGTLASATSKLGRAIYTLADELGTVKKEVRKIGAETKTLALTLQLLESRLSPPNRIAKSTLAVAKEIVEVCAADIKDLERSIKPLIVSDGRDMSLRQKTRWICTKSRIYSRQASLDSLKLTLSFFLQLLEIDLRNPVEDDVEKDIEAVVAETKHTKTSFLKAGMIDQKLQKAFEDADRRDDNSNQEEGEDLVGVASPLASQLGQMNVDSKYDLIISSKELMKETMVVTSDKRDQTPVTQHLPIEDDQFGYSRILNTSEEQFLEFVSWMTKTAAHILMQRRVTSFGLGLLEKSKSEDARNIEEYGESLSGVSEDNTRGSDIHQERSTSSAGSNQQPRGQWPRSADNQYQPRGATTFIEQAQDQYKYDSDASTTRPPSHKYAQAEFLNNPNEIPGFAVPPYERGHEGRAYPQNGFQSPQRPEYFSPNQSWQNNPYAYEVPRTPSGGLPPWNSGEQWRTSTDPEKENMRRQLREVEFEAMKKEAMSAALATARETIESEKKAEQARRKKEAQNAASIEEAVRLKLEAAIRAKEAAEAAAARKAKEESEWRKNLEEEAKLQVEIEGRNKLAADAASARKAQEEAEWRKNLEEEAKLKAEIEARNKLANKRPKRVPFVKIFRGT